MFGRHISFASFMMAVCDDDVDTINEYLKENPADVNRCNESGDTALSCAANYGHTAAARVLIDAGANVNFANELGYTALIYAAIHGHRDIVVALLAAGANVDAIIQSGNTASTLANANGHNEIYKLIIAARHGHAAARQDDDAMTASRSSRRTP